VATQNSIRSENTQGPIIRETMVASVMGSRFALVAAKWLCAPRGNQPAAGRELHEALVLPHVVEAPAPRTPHWNTKRTQNAFLRMIQSKPTLALRGSNTSSERLTKNRRQCDRGDATGCFGSSVNSCGDGFKPVESFLRLELACR
jgi:hypothetical protein